jgi:DNA-directed RNA polymerase specialized sigma24 family protein
MSEPSPPTLEATPPPLSEVEIRSEISSLTPGERTRLIKIAGYYAWKGRTSFEEPDELVQEAICRVLEGMRSWPRDLEKLRFLAGVIKSIAGDWKRAQRQALKRTVPLNEEREVGEARRGLMDYEGTEARGIRAKLDVKRIMTHFDDDPIAQKMLMGMADGARGEDLEQASGLSPTEYESKRKKIRRRIEKLKT